MDFKKALEKLVADVDMSSEESKRAGYRRCIEYADHNIKNIYEYNRLLALMGKKLGQASVRIDIGSVLPLQGDEKLQLSYSKATGHDLVGNVSGLEYLEKVISTLKHSPNPGEHAHFHSGKKPLTNESYPFVVALETDSWFDEQEQSEDQSNADNIPARKIRPRDIKAFVVLVPVPPKMPISRDKVYLISSFEKIAEQRVWKKKIRESKERMFVFRFSDDEGKKASFGLDLDDNEILFLTKEGLAQVNVK